MQCSLEVLGACKLLKVKLLAVVSKLCCLIENPVSPGAVYKVLNGSVLRPSEIFPISQESFLSKNTWAGRSLCFSQMEVKVHHG